MNSKLLSLLGIAKRAGRLSLGRDGARFAIIKNQAKLCILGSDASERLKNEFFHACDYENKHIPIFVLENKAEEISIAVGCKCAVLTVNDEGFAKKMKALMEQTAQGKE